MDSETWNAEACLDRVQAGDETAARDLYGRLLPLVLRVLRAHRPRQTAEEDLVQSVFMKVFANLDRWSGTAPLEHWVSRIAVNTCLKQLRHERVRPEWRWADLTEREAAAAQALRSTTEELPASQQVAARELIHRLMDLLAPADRLVVTLMYLEGRSVAEVRQVTGWSAATVKIRAFRARQKMKRQLNTLLREAKR